MAMENEDEEEAPRSPASVIRINDQTHEDVLVPACCRRRHGGHRELAMATVDDPQGPQIEKRVLLFFNTSKPEDQFFIGLPEAIIKADRIAVLGRGSWRRYRSDEEKPDDYTKIFLELFSAFINGRSCLAVLYQTTLGYAQLAAVIGTMVISSLRLKRQDYVDPIYQQNDDHKNIRWSLNIFYGLALSQCIVYFLVSILANPLKRMLRVGLTYKLGFWGVLSLARYVEECLLKCVSGDLRGAVSMDLVSFSNELLSSDSIENQLIGFRIVDHLLRSKMYKQRVLKKIRVSIGTIQMAVHMLSLKIDMDTDTRGHAARVLLELAPDLQVESFPGILAFLAADDTARKEIRNSRLIVRMLISFLAGEMNVVQDPIPRKMMETLATEALVLLTTHFKEKIVLSIVRESNVQAILAETMVEDMENIVHVLSDESADHRIGVGKLLQNLRAYQGAEYTELFKIIDKALPKVLETIDLAESKIESDSSDDHSSHAQELIDSAEGKGKLLESFIGLTVQICTNGDEMVFTDALRSANITVDEFVLKLKMILTVYKSPTADFPGVRRVVIQQMNWMMEKNPAYIVVFKKHEMDIILKETAETATKIENFLLFHSGVGAFEHEESISSIVSKSLGLITGSFA
uniref:Uncharacterized protein n=1 Tax=Oryza rufipogon TaxID=4529 RepID=A0A0E0MXD4_ORYRU